MATRPPPQYQLIPPSLPSAKPRPFAYPLDPVAAVDAKWVATERGEDKAVGGEDSSEPLAVRFLRRLESRAAEHLAVEETVFHRVLKRKKSHPAMGLGAALSDAEPPIKIKLLATPSQTLTPPDPDVEAAAAVAAEAVQKRSRSRTRTLTGGDDEGAAAVGQDGQDGEGGAGGRGTAAKDVDVGVRLQCHLYPLELFEAPQLLKRTTLKWSSADLDLDMLLSMKQVLESGSERVREWGSVGV